MMLGDLIEAALSRVGVTESSVSAWLGEPCNCQARKSKLNSLHYWAQQALTESTPVLTAKRYLNAVLGE